MAKKIIGQGKKGLLYFAQDPAFHHFNVKMQSGQKTVYTINLKDLDTSSCQGYFANIIVQQQHHK